MEKITCGLCGASIDPETGETLVTDTETLSNLRNELDILKSENKRLAELLNGKKETNVGTDRGSDKNSENVQGKKRDGFQNAFGLFND